MFKLINLSKLFVFLIALNQVSAGDLGGSKSLKKSRVGEVSSEENTEPTAIPEASHPLPPSLADEVDPNFTGNRGPGISSETITRYQPTGVKNQYRVVEDPTGKFKAGDTVTCDPDCH